MQIGLSELSFVIGAMGLILGALSYFRKTYAANDFAETKKDVEILKKQMDLFWGVIEKEMSKLLHSPHRPILDAFLDRNLGDGSLTRDEAFELVALLQKLIDSGDLSGDEVSYATLLMATTVAKYELDEYDAKVVNH